MQKKERMANLEVLRCVITAAGMILWYAMRDAGCLDYKNGLLPGSLWLVGMILWTDRTISAGDTEDNPEK